MPCGPGAAPSREPERSEGGSAPTRVGEVVPGECGGEARRVYQAPLVLPEAG